MFLLCTCGLVSYKDEAFLLRLGKGVSSTSLTWSEGRLEQFPRDRLSAALLWTLRDTGLPIALNELYN